MFDDGDEFEVQNIDNDGRKVMIRIKFRRWMTRHEMEKYDGDCIVTAGDNLPIPYKSNLLKRHKRSTDPN